MKIELISVDFVKNSSHNKMVSICAWPVKA